MTLTDRINQAARRLPAWPIYIVGVLLPVWLFWQAASGALGVDPIKALEDRLGLWGLKLIVAGLCVTPLRRFAGVNLIKYRRSLGLLAFLYIVLHFLTWLLLDLGLRWEQALGDIIKRPYITVGMVGLLAMVPLALTSNDRAVRWLGSARWQKLQKLAYLVALSGGVHFLWLVKAWPVEPFLYLGAILGLLAVRMIPKRFRLAA
ncbi:protein-methionine-sulfoxide reductase heme-binding subunit MsrQ [Defluviimonas sp. WL0050]|uniref:Protein-methionine-sulfoxide reductase heme-binding subunit MsrQ n=1 Tax=Albidovulum litorale TaxID=2984134 RepID=A0ABT2ZNB3_9RHOB|nr:protein-methionine-sulfoxide reductase heme-binding subunit MsrQ [Defluviimonas sp. WL0050]MCV2872621.1 protein-methionine-sulfoxide reductase heme-binding subunit MsrQ [Defluviimonas sp. WL0050]